MLWGLSLCSHLATDCCFWTLNVAVGHHQSASNPDGQDILERLLRRRQGRHLQRAQPSDCLPLSCWWTAARATDLEQNLFTPSALRLPRWLTPDLSPNLFSCFVYDFFSPSRNSCGFLELLDPAPRWRSFSPDDYELPVILAFVDHPLLDLLRCRLSVALGVSWYRKEGLMY
jgi:hypothetical protein